MINNLQQHNIVEPRGKITINETGISKTDVYYESLTHKGSDEGLLDVKSQKIKLISFDEESDRIEIFPINTLPQSDRFLGPKYEGLRSIILDGFDFDSIGTEEEVIDVLDELLPSGFVKDYNYGLGLLKEYRFIIQALEVIEINCLIISKRSSKNNEEKVTIDEESHTCIMKFSVYDKIRKEMNRIQQRVNKYGGESKSISANNIIAFYLKNEHYLQKKPSFHESSLSKVIGEGLSGVSTDLSRGEQKKVLEFVSRNKENIANTQPEILTKLRSDIETVTLKNLIKKYEDNLEQNLGENKWQKLFSENPFILSMAFGFPMMKIADTAYVGGKKITGGGDKITDFLVKNTLTNSIGLIEIKTPATEIISKVPYRKSVFYSTSQLSGSISQLLDQRSKFQQEISRLRDTSRMDVESYSIKSILIIGMIPKDLEKQKSFEIFRGNLKDIFVITFDELLVKLKDLHSFLNYESGE